MKNKTLILITASIITVTAIILTAGLSLLHGSAIENEPTPEIQSGTPISEPLEVIDPTEKPEAAPDDEIPVQEENEEEQVELVKTCKDENCDYPYHFRYDVVVAIYEHATGKLVSQKIYTEDQIWDDINLLHQGVYTRGECIYDPAGKYASNETPVYLDKAKYRVEVFAIWFADEYGSGELAFAYSYGADSDVMEMWASGILYTGGDLFIEYVDNLIADQMAELEAGKTVAPAAEDEITSIIGFDIVKIPVFPYSQSVWTGDFFEPFGRKTERFPYIED